MLRIDFNTRRRLGVFLLLAADAVIFLFIFRLALFVRMTIFPLVFHIPFVSQNAFRYEWILPLCLMIFLINGGYTKRFTFWDEVKFAWKSVLLASVAVFTFAFLGKEGELFSRSLLFIATALAVLIFPFARIAAKRAIYKIGFLKRKLIILGAGPSALLSLALLKKEANLGYEIAGFVDENPGTRQGIKVHGFIDRADKYVKRCRINDVLIAADLSGDRMGSLVNRVQQKAENTLFVPDLAGVAAMGAEFRHFFSDRVFVLEIKNNLAHLSTRALKRLLDFAGGWLFLIVFALPMLAIALLIKATSKGPAIISQKRIGRNGKPFNCYKFRTMVLRADDVLRDLLAKDPAARKEWETQRKIKDDPRVTVVGKFLRTSSLDELPQIFNVLAGQMSVVGPRPVTEGEINEHYREHSDICLSVPPGITGLWQVSGRNDISYSQRVTMDAWYVRNWCLWLDIVILMKTVGVVLRREGAY